MCILVKPVHLLHGRASEEADRQVVCVCVWVSVFTDGLGLGGVFFVSFREHTCLLYDDLF